MSDKRAVVAQVGDLQAGQMQQVSVDKTRILLVRVEGQFHALGANCTHYGAPLHTGVLSGNRIVCPWHNACFNVVTGDQQQPPGLESLPRYRVEVEGNDVVVWVPEKRQFTRTPEMVNQDQDIDQRLFVILGTGAAGANAAETLRQAGFQGRVVMVTAEAKLPYDRPKLSKQYLEGKAPEKSLPLRSLEFYENHGIEILTDTLATRVDPAQKTISFAGGDTLRYNSLLLATGGQARTLKVPGAELSQIFTLRSFADSDVILAAAEQGQQVVVIGSSFIGMEVAASLTQQGSSVTVVSPESVPFEKVLGPEVGRVFQQEHERQGVTFRLETKAERFEGDNRVQAAVLDNGDRLPADLVVVGIGVEPVTDYLTGVNLNADGSVSTDEYLRVREGLYAAGDMARFPLAGQPTRIEHWRLAAQQGRIAAQNMAGNQVAFTGVPFFWTGQFDLTLRYVGHAETWDQVLIQGDLSEADFLAYYIQDQQVRAVAGINRDREIAALSELMRLDQMPAVADLEQDSLDPCIFLEGIS